MSRPVVLYASDHGYGHAMRLLALAAALRERGVAVHYCAGAALQAALPTLRRLGATPAEVRLDVGLAAAPRRLAVDEERSRALVRAWLRRLPELVDQETIRLRALGAALVVADAPVAAVAGAARAGVPAVVCGNFTWLDLYGERYGSDVADALRQGYGGARLGLRLRLGQLALAGLPRVRDVPGLLARPVRRGRAAVRGALGLNEREPVLGLGLGRSFHPGALSPLLATAGASGRVLAPADALPAPAPPAACPFPPDDPDPQDFLAAADAVLAKAGYSTLAEAALAGVPVLALPAAGNAESRALCADVAALGLGVALSGEEEVRALLADPAGAIARARAELRARPAPAAPHIIDLLVSEGLLEEGVSGRR